MKIDSKTPYTKAAGSHVRARRVDLGVDAPANWFEVAHAYDQGLRHGLEANHKRQVKEMLAQLGQQPNNGAVRMKAVHAGLIGGSNDGE